MKRFNNVKDLYDEIERVFGKEEREECKKDEEDVNRIYDRLKGEELIFVDDEEIFIRSGNKWYGLDGNNDEYKEYELDERFIDGLEE